VTLTATPAAGWGFAGWSGGACSGFGSCVVTMNAAQSVTATFAQSIYTLSVAVTGNGAVTSSPSGINCGSICTMNYANGTPVMLTATPSGGATFKGWGGACSGAGGCTVTMTSIATVTAFFSSPGGSPTSRSWVSAALGSDSNPCTSNAPCLTFAAALAMTTPGGEIDVRDPGDFGPVTITGSITIDGAGEAGVLVSGSNGIVINAGSNDVVNLRGLILDGVNASLDGIRINSAAHVNIEACVVQEFSSSGQLAGIFVSPSAGRVLVNIAETTILANNAGIIVKPASGVTADVVIERSRIDDNFGAGVQADGSAGGISNVAISDSSISFNVSSGVAALGGPGNVAVGVMRAAIADNGGAAIQGQGAAIVTVGNSQLDRNAAAAQVTSGASVLSYRNNQVIGNAVNGTFSGFAGGQ
jgi:hypothetical protein